MSATDPQAARAKAVADAERRAAEQKRKERMAEVLDDELDRMAINAPYVRY